MNGPGGAIDPVRGVGEEFARSPPGLEVQAGRNRLPLPRRPPAARGDGVTAVPLRSPLLIAPLGARGSGETSVTPGVTRPRQDALLPGTLTPRALRALRIPARSGETLGRDARYGGSRALRPSWLSSRGEEPPYGAGSRQGWGRPHPQAGQAHPLASIYISTREIFLPSKPDALLGCALSIYYYRRRRASPAGWRRNSGGPAVGEC
jgi:hypothetical protein